MSLSRTNRTKQFLLLFVLIAMLVLTQVLAAVVSHPMPATFGVERQAEMAYDPLLLEYFDDPGVESYGYVWSG